MSADLSKSFFISGRDYLAQFPNFELVGRDCILSKLTAILMRKSANSVMMIGSGGVGCSAICLGIQASKDKDGTPFDIVSKRFFWLDSDLLFSSGDTANINTDFNKMLRTLSRTPNSVLILDDMRDFIDAARNNGCTNLINALMHAVKRKNFQIIMEARDEDLQTVLSCHSDMKEAYTLLDIEEPDEALLNKIIETIAETRLFDHHKIKISTEAIETAIDITNKYRVRDIGLSRAQPERTLTLLDRALTTYRLEAHANDPRLEAIESKLTEAQLQYENSPSDEHKTQLDKLTEESLEIKTSWELKQSKIKQFDAEVRDGEAAIRDIELSIEEQLKSEQERDEHLDSSKTETKGFTSFASRAAAGGYESEEVTLLKQKIKSFQKEIDFNRGEFSKLIQEINQDLKLDKDHVLKEFSEISGIPVNKLTQDERAKLLHLDQNLNNRVFGQEEAVEKLANQIRVARAGLQSPDKPQAVFMFLGPSGVGKTELAKALTSELFDDERSLLRFDMSEYMEKHAVAKLIGSPPGYEGYEAGGILTNEMRKNPRRIILFDEIEKAHPDIFNVFLQILDDARLTDNRGLTVSFRDATILMTTNIGTSYFLSESDYDIANTKAMEDLESEYRPEFLARFNGKRNIVCFKTLPLAVIEKIALRDIEKLNLMVKSSSPNIDIEFKDNALVSMCRDHYKPVNGARGITGYIEGVIKPEIANTVLFDQNASGKIVIDYDEAAKEVFIKHESKHA